MYCDLLIVFFSLFFFKQKTAYEMRISDWSSDVCSSDLKAAIEVFAKPYGELIGKTAIELVIWAVEAGRQQYLTQLRASGSVRDFETTMRRANGDTVPVLYSGALVSISGQDYALSVMQDISERKRAEQQLRESVAMKIGRAHV